jgi:hypothetical protein
LFVFCCLCGSWATVGLADVPIFGDSFRSSTPGHAPGSPVHGARLERGHGKWKGTSGLYFDDGRVSGGGVDEHVRFAFHPVEHQRSAVVYLEAWIDPGSNGWSGVGFTNGEHGPLPNTGQLWMKIDDRGRIEVRANGASNSLYKDSHTHPAYVEGENLIRIEYNRRLNTARAWINKTELLLGPVDKHGFVPDIQAVAFQLRDNGNNLTDGDSTKRKSLGGSGIGGILAGFDDAVVGDQFNVVDPLQQGHHEGDLLNGVATQFGDETWYANADAGFGPGYATNIGLGAVKVLAPFNPDDHPGYATASTEAIINPGDADWVGIGFASNATGSLNGHGTVWAQFFATGVVKVRLFGITQTLYVDNHLDPAVFTGGLPVKLSFNRLTGAVLLEMGETTLGISPISVTVPSASLPLATVAAGFQAKRDVGFTAANQCAIDDFAVNLADELPPLEITENPVSLERDYGGNATFQCQAGGGVTPYSYRWQHAIPQVMLKNGIGIDPAAFEDIPLGTPGMTGIESSTLEVYPITTGHQGYYRCVVTDSNSVPSEAASASAYLNVFEPLITDAFTTGGTTGRVSGVGIDGLYTETGNTVWAATSGAVLGDGILTNQVAPVHVIAEVPVTTSMLATYQLMTVSANLLLDQADWIGIGFSDDTLQSMVTPGTAPCWAQLFSDGGVKVRVNDTIVFSQNVLDATEMLSPVHVRVDYDFASDTPAVFVNGTELALSASLPIGTIAAATVNAREGVGFANANMFAIDDFAVTGSESVPLPRFDVHPVSRMALLGEEVTFNVDVSGGVPPYTLEWSHGGEVVTSGGPYTVVTAADGSSSSLTIASVEPSVEGYYEYTVLDSRYGDPGWGGRRR